MINDSIDPNLPGCRCGARAARRRTACRKCRSRDRWHRHQDGARRHQRGDY